MRPRRIILVRHGQSTGNADKTIYANTPDYALQLSALGRQQARERGEQLKAMLGDESVMFYVSPYWRTRQTYQEIAKFFPNAPVREEPLLREQEWGHLRTPETFKGVEAQRDAFSSFYYRLPDGESGADVYDRTSDQIGVMHRDFRKMAIPKKRHHH